MVHVHPLWPIHFENGSYSLNSSRQFLARISATRYQEYRLDGTWTMHTLDH